MYEYKCKIVKIVDGDTVDVDLDLGFGVWLRDERVRIMGIDTPESRTSDAMEKIFGQAAKNISGGKLLSQLFENTEKFNMQTQIQLLLLQKTMVVVEGVARKLDPDANIWEISKPILEDWLKKVKDPLNKASEVINDASEVIKRLPDLPNIMDKANDVMTLIAQGKFDPNTLSYHSLKEEELKLELMRNKILGGILVLVIIILIVFK